MSQTASAFNNSGAGPAAGTVLCSLSTASAPAPLIAGHEYAVTVAAYYTGTVTAADQDNAGLYVDGVLISALLIPPSGAGATDPNPQRFNVVTTTGLIQLKVIGAGSGTEVFHTALVCEDVGAGISSI
jgi:hypothetical protein